MNQADLVWVSFPLSDLERRKFRPALVVSHDGYNARHEDVVVCAVTSNLVPSPYKLPLSDADLSEGRLPVPSMVRVDKVLQVERGLLEPAFARLKGETFDRVSDAIAELVRRPKR